MIPTDEVPRLIVFDLDFTLWDCGGVWVDCAAYPFRRQSDGSIVDGNNRLLRFYEEVPDILGEIEEMGCETALASRTSQPLWAGELLELLGKADHFSYEEIYPGSKVAHFESLKNRTGCEWSEMLFFDDEPRNIEEVGSLGVSCVEVRGGMSLRLFHEGLVLFASKCDKKI